MKYSRPCSSCFRPDVVRFSTVCMVWLLWWLVIGAVNPLLFRPIMNYPPFPTDCQALFRVLRDYFKAVEFPAAKAEGILDRAAVRAFEEALVLEAPEVRLGGCAFRVPLLAR